MQYTEIERKKNKRLLMKNLQCIENLSKLWEALKPLGI